jgi:exosome complex component RRP45
VLAVVSAEIVKPFDGRSSEGQLHFHTSFSGMSEPDLDAQKLADRAVEVGRLIEKCIRDSKAVDTEALCLVPGEKVWAVRCDVHILDHEGNVIDCTLLATVTALQAFRRPDVTIAGESVIVHSMEDKQPVPLAVHHIPVGFTFAFFKSPVTVRTVSRRPTSGDEDDDSEFFNPSASVLEQSNDVFLCALDPSLKEEHAASGSMTLTLNTYNELCCVHKSGGLPVTTEQFTECLRVASAKVADMTKLIKQALQANSLTLKQRQANILAQHNKTTAQPIDTVDPTELPSIPVPVAFQGSSAAHYSVDVAMDDQDESADEEMDDQSNAITSSAQSTAFNGGATAWEDDGEPDSEVALKSAAVQAPVETAKREATKSVQLPAGATLTAAVKPKKAQK